MKDFLCQFYGWRMRRPGGGDADLTKISLSINIEKGIRIQIANNYVIVLHETPFFPLPRSSKPIL